MLPVRSGRREYRVEAEETDALDPCVEDTLRRGDSGSKLHAVVARLSGLIGSSTTASSGAVVDNSCCCDTLSRSSPRTLAVLTTGGASDTRRSISWLKCLA